MKMSPKGVHGVSAQHKLALDMPWKSEAKRRRVVGQVGQGRSKACVSGRGEGSASTTAENYSQAGGKGRNTTTKLNPEERRHFFCC